MPGPQQQGLLKKLKLCCSLLSTHMCVKCLHITNNSYRKRTCIIVLIGVCCSTGRAIFCVGLLA